MGSRGRVLWCSLVCVLIQAPALAQVKVWEGTLSLPTYEEGDPDVNPPFDLFKIRSFITYPYTTRENLTNRKSSHTWRTLNLENEYLKLVVLPDLGGRVYSCIDKSNGQELFYANSSIKYAQVAFRGAWVALGIEFNFPVSHNWMTVSPVDFGTVRNADESASIWVGNIDRPYDMTWRVAVTLRPQSSLLEQTVTLYNGSDVRHRFYWWNTASVRSWDDSHIIYPMELSASHGYADVDTWPVDSAGYDLSIPANHTRGFVSRFAVGSREPFMGVYHPQTKSGMVHFAFPDQAPAKKIWSWGWDEDGRDWRKALSDDESAYLEIQAGLFRNQETYAFLEPQQIIRFNEYYMPVRGIGGFSRANLNGVVNVWREAGTAGAKSLWVGINVNREVPGGRVRIKDGARILAEEPFNLKPSGIFQKNYRQLNGEQAYTIELVDNTGAVLLSHTEGKYDFDPKSDYRLGPQDSYAFPPLEQRAEGDFLELGKNHELWGRLLVAADAYQQGLERFPESFELNKAAGRLAVQLKRYDQAVKALSKAQWRISNDPAVSYYLGNAWYRLGEARKARVEWEKATLLPQFRPAALVRLAGLTAQEGHPDQALALIRKALEESPQMIRAGGMEVALLRRLGRMSEARERLAYWRQMDLPNSFLRNEAVELGAQDEGLWRHLAGDPERILEIAVDYMGIGLYEDAVKLLNRSYPSEGVIGEPGFVLPQNYPLIAYYRGYCREKAGTSGKNDCLQASGQPTKYVFPNRPETFTVLQKALEINPDDATARFLLGSWYLSGGMADEALREWGAAKKLNPRIPVLHRNIGMTLIQAKSTPAEALKIFEEGMNADASNVDLYLGADQCLSLLGRGGVERIDILRKYPNQAEMPTVLVHKLALALAEDGRSEEAERLYEGRFFPREEFGTNVRQTYLEVRLQRALRLARENRKDEAAAVTATIGKDMPGLEFTRDGLTPFIENARFQYYLGEIANLRGDRQGAEEHWEKAAAAGGYRYLAFGYLAAKRLGPVDQAGWTARLQSGLKEAEAYGGHFPGLGVYAQGTLLQALGRKEAGNQKLKEALLYPDKGMSHYLCREALGGEILGMCFFGVRWQGRNAPENTIASGGGQLLWPDSLERESGHNKSSFSS